MTGLPGSGKSTVAKGLLEMVQMGYVETDRCWLSVFPTPQHTHDESNTVFLEVCRRVEKFLTENQSTLAEGVFASHNRIVTLKAIASAYQARVIVVGLRCDMTIAFERMEERLNSDGTKPVPVSLWIELQGRLLAWEAEEQVLLIDSSAESTKSAVRMVLTELAQNQ